MNITTITVVFMLGNFITGVHEGYYAFIGHSWCAKYSGMMIVVAQQKKMMPSSASKSSGNIPDKQCRESWEIEYNLSGGLAGILRQLKLSSSGRLLASDLKKKIHIEQQVPAEQLSEIAGILRKIDLSRAPKTHRDLYQGCADCFQHELTVVADGQRHKLYVDDTTLEDPEYVPLIKLLSSLINQAFVEEEP
jgi:hypothetical protein